MGTATWVKSDIATKGAWVGVYGADGYNIIGDQVSYPGYATVTPSGNGSYDNGTTANAEDLQRGTNHSQRTQSGWYGGTWTIDIALTSGSHQIGIYCFDFSLQRAVQKFEILNVDSGSVVLDTRYGVHSYERPLYLLWNCSGHIAIRISGGNVNNLLSGLFFDSAGSIPAATGTASFIATDSSTQGDWVGKPYGVDGYNIVTDQVSYPSYATVSAVVSGTFGGGTTSDVLDLKRGTNHSQRVNSGWYASGGGLFDITLSSGSAVGIYVRGPDGGRSMDVIVTDSIGNILDSARSITGFYTAPIYMQWNCTGHINILAILTGGANIVVSALFFDPAPSSPGGATQPIMMVIC